MAAVLIFKVKVIVFERQFCFYQANKCLNIEKLVLIPKLVLSFTNLA